jgi:hypothetical protein
MSFPLTPVDGALYTTALGTNYRYDSTRTAWNIVSQTMTGVTGIQGSSGIQGATGLRGDTGIQGNTGVQGNTGIAGSSGGITGTAGYVVKFFDGTSVVNSTMYNYAGKGMELNVGNAIDASAYLVVKGNNQKLAELGRSNVSGNGSGELNLYTEGVLYTKFNPTTASVGTGLAVTGTLAVGPSMNVSGSAIQVTQSMTPTVIGPGMLYNVGPLSADATRTQADAYNSYATTHISDMIRLDRTRALYLYDDGTISDSNYLFQARGYVWQVAANYASYTDFIDFACYADSGTQHIIHLHTNGETSSTLDASRLNISVVQPSYLGDVFWDSAKLVISSNIPVSDGTALIGYDIKYWTCKA